MSNNPTVMIGEIITAGRERVSVARDEVNRPMINHLCEAMEESNPIYLDPDAARAAGHPDVGSPPSALQVWNMINPSDPII